MSVLARLGSHTQGASQSIPHVARLTDGSSDSVRIVSFIHSSWYQSSLSLSHTLSVNSANEGEIVVAPTYEEAKPIKLEPPPTSISSASATPSSSSTIAGNTTTTYEPAAEEDETEELEADERPDMSIFKAIFESDDEDDDDDDDE